MASTIKLPGIGPVKTTYVYVGGALVAGFVAFSYYRASQAPATDGVIDETSSELQFGDAMTTDFAPDGSGFGFGVPTPTNPTSFDPNLDRDPVTDNEWVDRVVEYLDGVGVDKGTASLAVARYRLKDCLSPTQMDIVRQGVGRYGPPPQSPNLAMHSCPAGPTTPPPATGTKPGKPSGIRSLGVGRNSVRFGWNPVPGATGYNVFSVGSGGKQKIGTTATNSFTRSGLRAKTRYTFWVSAFNSAGTGPQSASGSFTTKR